MWDSLFPAENSFLEASYANTSLLDPGLDLARYVKLDGSLASARQVPTLFPLGEFDSVLLVCVFLASALGSSVGSRAAPVPVGIGGGGILVPLLVALGEFTVREAVPLTQERRRVLVSDSIGGGGGILMPLLVTLGEFTVREAVPLTQVAVLGAAIVNVWFNVPNPPDESVAVLGAAIVNVWFNVPKRHPFLDKPLIDGDVARERDC
ncbi:hypothetical protein T484DRAFT_1857905 [Baffinella frigidus]|nr:hypothetical protein T484DRAFT_1857905 [Cryptophyta sp. CCMP2293]